MLKNMPTADFKLTPYFSWPFLIVGVAMSFFGLMALIEGLWWVALLLELVSLLIMTTHYRVAINFAENTFHDYVWVLGMKVGEKGSFDAVEYVFVKRAKVSQTVHARVASTTIQKEVYDGYLKFSNGNTIHLLTKDSQKAVLHKLRMVAVKLHTTVVDYTQGEARAL
jgi:hypothetical protein